MLSMTDSNNEIKNTSRGGVNDIKRENAAPFGDFIKVVAHKAKLTPKSVQKVYNAMYDYIIEELQLREVVYLKGLGYFGAIQIGGYDKLLPEGFGMKNLVYKYVPPQYKIKFRPTPKFVDMVNSPIGKKKEEKHKRGELITPTSKLKQERRTMVKNMLMNEGKKIYDPKYAEESVETLVPDDFDDEE